MTNWHQLKIEGTLTQLNVNPDLGLTKAEAKHRLAQHGPNELVERGFRSLWVILWEQFTAIMVVVLIIAALVSAFLGDYKDTIAIMVIVVLNAALGFTQEYRAEKAMAALKQLSVPSVKVYREGHVREISARNLVPGDILILEAGAIVPADGRLLESINLQIQEAALTGESEPVDKHTDSLTGQDLPVADRRNMIYMGTVITYGRGKAVITETGMHTQLGRIAEMIQTVEREPTPLQRRLEQVGRGLAVISIAIVSVVFVLGLLRGEDLQLMFLTAISMTVAAVPEGLPAVVTIALALGAQRMLKRQALIRKLPAVETLGSVDVICSDKTGTLTENRMTVTILDLAGCTLKLSKAQSKGVPPEVESTLHLLLTGAALCNDAHLEKGFYPHPPPATPSSGIGRGLFSKNEPDKLNTKNHPQAVGDPTETALVVAAAEFGLSKSELERTFPRVAEVPFTSERKRMTTAHRLPAEQPAWLAQQPPASHVAFCKGAMDSLLEVSNRVWANGQPQPLSDEWRNRIQAANDQLAQEGMRVLGVAFKPLDALPDKSCADSFECDLIFIGLMGMIDPPRAEVKAAVQKCQLAGIRPIMITGDHPLTAQSIARALNLDSNGSVMAGREIESKTVEELRDIAEKVSVYARVSPEHKLKIVQALQDKAHVVSMTGDGVNDAPALKKADIGVAMGVVGTDVSKEAADMVLLNDNFATIVAAVEEGRVIYDNIRKFLKYTMTSNSGEIWVMLLAPFLGMPLPLLPLQILWINLVTDGLPGLALAVEPAERDTMRRPPYHPSENIFGRGMGRHILWVGLLMGLVSLVVGWWGWRTALPAWQTMVFTTLTLSQMGHAMAIRSNRDSLFTIGLFSNVALLGAVLLTFVLQLAVIYAPFLQQVFNTVSLSATELLISLLLSTVVFGAVEIEKWVLRRRSQ